MLTLEAIAMLGLVYAFLMYATLRAIRVEEKERKRTSASSGALRSGDS